MVKLWNTKDPVQTLDAMYYTAKEWKLLKGYVPGVKYVISDDATIYEPLSDFRSRYPDLASLSITDFLKEVNSMEGGYLYADGFGLDDGLGYSDIVHYCCGYGPLSVRSK